VKLKKRDNISILIFWILFSFILFFVISNLKIEQKRKELTKEIDNLTAELKVLEKRQADLRELMLKSKEETFLEEKAREEGYVREGEEIIVIKKIEDEKTEKEPETIWYKIFNLLKK